MILRLLVELYTMELAMLLMPFSLGGTNELSM